MRDLTFAELDAELAEQLPARELMSCCRGGGSYSNSSQNNGSSNGNTSGLIAVAVLNGNFSGNNVR
jgi:hypothetical protein